VHNLVVLHPDEYPLAFEAFLQMVVEMVNNLLDMQKQQQQKLNKQQQE
jgi:hypothetical protein